MVNFCPYFVNKSTVFCLWMEYSIHIFWISDSLQFYHCPSFLMKTLHTSKSCLMIRNPKSAPYSVNDTSVLQLQALPLLRNSFCCCCPGWWSTGELSAPFRSRGCIHQPASWLHQLPSDPLSLTKQCCHKTALSLRALPFLHRCYHFNGHTQSLGKAKIMLCQVPLGQDTSWCWFFWSSCQQRTFPTLRTECLCFLLPGSLPVWHPGLLSSAWFPYDQVKLFQDNKQFLSTQHSLEHSHLHSTNILHTKLHAKPRNAKPNLRRDIFLAWCSKARALTEPFCMDIYPMQRGQ